MLKQRLLNQWDNPDHRESRLIETFDAWPIALSIGRPDPQMPSKDAVRVKQHIETWRQVNVGEVQWRPARFPTLRESVNIPARWLLHNPKDWVDAIDEARVREEFRTIEALIAKTDPQFHSLLVRKRVLRQDKTIEEMVLASRLAMTLSPQCANGQPLRMLNFEGIDTKFFERNGRLITALLDVRFDEEVSRMGLENFLGAFSEGDHWLLVVDLDGSLLPFQKCRVPSCVLRETPLPGDRLLIVENETSLHQIPKLPNTIAVLGAGFDLNWTEGNWLTAKEVAYWGDIDTWGLRFLAKARLALPNLTALLMTAEVFEQHSKLAVVEPIVAGTELPCGLTQSEQELYARLLKEPKGRLEQEFLPCSLTQKAITRWREN